MKKLAPVVTSAAVIAAGLANANVVKAEEVVTVQPTTNIEQSAPVVEVTPQEVDAAKAEKDNADAVVAEQNTAVQEAQTAHDNQQAEIASIETAIEEGAAVTPEVIEEAKSDVVDLQAQANSAESAVLDAQDAVTPIEEEKAVAQTEVNKATNAVSDANAEVTAAQAQKATVEEAVKPEVVEQAQAEVNTVNTAVENQTAVVAEAQSALNLAQAADENHAQALQDAQVALATAEQTKDAKTTVANELKVVADQKVQEVKDIEAANADLFGGIRSDIRLDDEFVAKMKEYLAVERAEGETLDQLFAREDVIKEQVIAIEQRIQDSGVQEGLNQYEGQELVGGSQYFTYNDPALIENIAKAHATERDETLPRYDLNNLSDAMLTELNVFAGQVLNGFRAQFGLTPLTPNKNTLAIAKDVAKNYQIANNSEIYSGHNVEAILDAGRKHNIDTNVHFENLVSASALASNNTLTKSELFAWVAETMTGFFYEGMDNHHYQHAKSLIGRDAGQDGGDIAVSFSTSTGTDNAFSKSDGETYSALRMHVISMNKKHMIDDLVMPGDPDPLGERKPGQVRIIPTNKREEYKAWQARRQAKFDELFKPNAENTITLPGLPDLASLRQARDTALANYAAANGELLSATTAYNQAKRHYDNLVAGTLQTPAAQTTLTNAQAELTRLQADQTAKQTRLTTLQAAQRDAQSQLAKAIDRLNAANAAKATADANLTQANTNLATVDARLTRANDAVATAQTTLNNVKAQLADAKANVAELEVKAANLENNREALRDARDTLLVLADALADAKAELAQAQADANVATDNYNQTKARFDMEEAIREAIRNAKFELDDEKPLTLELPTLELDENGEEIRTAVPEDAPVLQLPELVEVTDVPTDAPTVTLPTLDPKDVEVVEVPADAPKVALREVTIRDEEADLVKTRKSQQVKGNAVSSSIASTLPQTGEINMTSIFTPAVLSFLIGLGLVIDDKKRKI